MQSLADPGSSLGGRAEEDLLLANAEADDGNHRTAPCAVPHRDEDLRAGRCRHRRAVLDAVHHAKAAGAGLGIEAMPRGGDHQCLQDGATQVILSALSALWRWPSVPLQGVARHHLVCRNSSRVRRNSSRVQLVAFRCGTRARHVGFTCFRRAQACAATCASSCARGRSGPKRQRYAG